MLKPLLACLALGALSLPAQAVLTIEITQGLATGQPIAIVPFGWKGKTPVPADIAGVVESDLGRSGRFQLVPRATHVSQPRTEREVVYKDWRVVKAEALLIGQIEEIGADQYQVEFRLFDIYKERLLTGFRFVVPRAHLRTVSHQISDIVYEQLTGEKGAFNSRIAYVTKEGSGTRATYRLQIADSDGYGATSVLNSVEPIMSPAWSPDGLQLAYVSFEQRRPVLFVQNVITTARDRVAEFDGINSAPAWSPDGKRLALTLSRDGNPEIYVMDLATRGLTRLTRHPAIDTEPSWSPDGGELVFTSDRSGKPQIYRMRADGSNVERVTFEGEYNARASYSRDGSMLTLISGTGRVTHAAVYHLRSRSLQVLTDTPLDESPTFAPNGRLILYATERQGRGVLASVSADGRVRQLLKLDEGDVREPVWSPFVPTLTRKE
jgi:TolB protein